MSAGAPYDVAQFSDLVGTTIAAVTSEGARVELELTAAHARDPAPNLTSGFSLDFVLADRYEPFPQQLVQLEHPTMGTQAIFLVPVARGPEGVTYEAVFSFPPASDTPD